MPSCSQSRSPLRVRANVTSLLTIMYSRMESEEAEALDSVKEADCCRERCRTLTWPAKGQVQATLQ